MSQTKWGRRIRCRGLEDQLKAKLQIARRECISLAEMRTVQPIITERKIGVVEDIKCFDTELQIESLEKLKIFE